ncbi:thioredoxin-disulfide reductase [Photobacterium swingsii]|uniref:Thioredoxin reductase n=1 Tax=Photobacterium swingsii TaxID=680026 RepID=A0A0J8VHF7_9GAMM|nr:thioredoxin-disulfide reductase [Photobacterium swingsii]KMV31915.1 pyridine nucleotide-disulfide oxidoreductase [Photobacterium swingsii]PSW25563.1 thioredoxin-disulfide reductase [Photobacterium swingsii]
MSELYDVIIIGGGAGGMSAGVYAARGKMKTLIIEDKRNTGGQAATTSEMENYPGIVEATGPQLMDMFREHCNKFGVEFARGLVSDITIADDGFIKTLTTSKGETYQTKSIIVATGATPRILGITGESEFRGKGVSYCATCDADFYEELDVVVVGSGNTAVEESVFLTKFVNKVTMIVLHDQGILDADRTAQEQAFANDKIEFVWNSVVEEICGDELVTGVKLKHLKTGEISELSTDGVFMFVGTVPKTDFIKGQVALTPQGYVITNEKQETNVPGIFAVGDVTDKFLRQVVTAAGDGAVAAVAADRYIEEEENWRKSVSEFGGTAMVAFWNPLSKESLAVINQLEQDCKDKPDQRVVTIDTYKSQNIANRFSVSEVPVVIRFDAGQEAKRVDVKDIAELDTLY